MEDDVLTEQSMNFESGLVGAILLDGSIVPEISGIVGPEDFVNPYCQAVYSAALALNQSGKTVDPVLIRAEALQDGVELSNDFLAQCMQVAPHSSSCTDYAKKIADASRTRKIRDLTYSIQADPLAGPDELLARLENGLGEISKTARTEDLLLCAADVPYEPPRWLMPPYFQFGKGTMIQADGGTGKTAFMCAIAAAVTTGKPLFPGGPRAESTGDVLMISVEDDLPVLRGRIDANGGDLSRVHFMANASGLTLNSPEIERAVKLTKAKLLVFDPLQAFMGAKVDMFRANETRPVLAKLFDMCDRNSCACAVISHLGKSKDGKTPVNRSLGSTDIGASMRSILHISCNPADDAERVAVHVKCSNAPRGQSLSYTIGDRGGVQWFGYSDMGVEDLEAIQHREQRNIPYENEPLVQVFNQLITDRPAGGFWSYTDVKSESAKLLGFPAFDKPAELKNKLNGPLAHELQKNDGLIVTAGEQGPKNVRGIRIERYVVPNGYQIHIQEG